MTPAVLAVLVIFPALMAYAAASDLLTMTISNRLCLGLVVTFVLCAGLLGLSWTEIGWHLAAGFVFLSVCFGLFAAGWIGGGDAKLAAATALWFGFDQLMPYLLFSAIAGGILTLMIMRLRAAPLPAIAANWTWLHRLHSPKEGVPYGIALALSALFVLPDTSLWHAAIGV